MICEIRIHGHIDKGKLDSWSLAVNESCVPVAAISLQGQSVLIAYEDWYMYCTTQQDLQQSGAKAAYNHPFPGSAHLKRKDNIAW